MELTRRHLSIALPLLALAGPGVVQAASGIKGSYRSRSRSDDVSDGGSCAIG